MISPIHGRMNPASRPTVEIGRCEFGMGRIENHGIDGIVADSGRREALPHDFLGSIVRVLHRDRGSMFFERFLKIVGGTQGMYLDPRSKC